MEQLYRPKQYSYEIEDVSEIYTPEEITRLESQQQSYRNRPVQYSPINEQLLNPRGDVTPSTSSYTGVASGAYLNPTYRNKQKLRKLFLASSYPECEKYLKYDTTMAARAEQSDFLTRFLETQPLAAGMKITIESSDGNPIQRNLTQNDIDEINRNTYRNLQQIKEARDPERIDIYEKKHLSLLLQIIRAYKRDENENRRIERELRQLTDEQQREFFNKIQNEVSKRRLTLDEQREYLKELIEINRPNLPERLYSYETKYEPYEPSYEEQQYEEMYRDRRIELLREQQYEMNPQPAAIEYPGSEETPEERIRRQLERYSRSQPTRSRSPSQIRR